MAVTSTTHQEVRVALPATAPARWFYLPLSILGWLGVAGVFIWFASPVVTTILLVVMATLIAFALSPAVRLLSRVLPKAVALLIVYVVFLGLLGTLGYFVVNTSVQEATALVQYLRQQLTPGADGQTPLAITLHQYGISTTQITSVGQQVLKQAEGVAGNVLPAIVGLLTTVLDVVVILVLSIYLVLSGGQFRRFAVRAVPQSLRERTVFVVDTVSKVAGGYIRGQVTLAAITATLVTGMLLLFHVPYAILLGVLAFALDFIPVLGSILSGVMSVLVALIVGVPTAIGVLIAFLVIHVIDGYVLGPRIVGQALGLSPIVTFVALLAGAELFGIWGALLAAPFASILQAFVIATWTAWRNEHPGEFPRRATCANGSGCGAAEYAHRHRRPLDMSALRRGMRSFPCADNSDMTCGVTWFIVIRYVSGHRNACAGSLNVAALRASCPCASIEKDYLSMPHVLIASPNPTTRQLVATWLQTAGYAVTVVANGLDVISVLPHLPQRLVLVLDQQIPHFSGSEIAQLILTIPRPHQYRFIFMTAQARDQDALAPISRRLHAPILVTPFPAATFLRAIAADGTDRAEEGAPTADGASQAQVCAATRGAAQSLSRKPPQLT